MAVVQISRIQHRRGRGNNGTTFPQLASGELGWAIDDQKLYIGNGSVTEGAPFVGNTRILTENDNIFDLANQYQYKKNVASIQTGPSPSLPVQRSIQDRLDDTTSINNFIRPEERLANDYTDALQRAIDQLFLNDATKGAVSSRTILELEAGEYTISAALKIPPYANIRGAGKDKTIIKQTGNFPVFYTVDQSSTPGEYVSTLTEFTSLTQPRYIDLVGITFKNEVSEQPVAILNATKNSHFSDVKFEGAGAQGNEIVATEVALKLTAFSSQVSCTDNIFENCDFVNASYGLLSTDEISSNLFEHCLFNNLGRGVEFGLAGNVYGPTNNKFVSCRFTNIDLQGILVTKGTGNLSLGNKFVRVGNDGPSSTTAVTSVIQYDAAGNVSNNDYFDRAVDLSENQNYPYISQYSGKIIGDHKFNQELEIIQASFATVLFRLGAANNSRYKVHYIYTSNVANIVRQGVLYVLVDKINTEVRLSDEYDFNGDEALAENLKFTAELVNVGGDTNEQTVNIKYTNSTADDLGVFNYWYEIVS